MHCLTPLRSSLVKNWFPVWDKQKKFNDWFTNKNILIQNIVELKTEFSLYKMLHYQSTPILNCRTNISKLEYIGWLLQRLPLHKIFTGRVWFTKQSINSNMFGEISSTLERLCYKCWMVRSQVKLVKWNNCKLQSHWGLLI